MFSCSSRLVEEDGRGVGHDVLAVEAEVALAVDLLAVARQDGEGGAAHRVAVHDDQRPLATLGRARHPLVQARQHAVHPREHLDETLGGVLLARGGVTVRRRRLDHCVLREVEEVADVVVLEVLDHLVVPRTEAHLRRVVPLHRLGGQLGVPPRVGPARLRRARERREHDQVGRQLHAVELVGGVLRLLLAGLVERVVRLVHVPLVHPRLRVARRLAVPTVEQVEAQRQPLRLEIRAERKVAAGHIDRQPDGGGLGGQRGLVHLVFSEQVNHGLRQGPEVGCLPQAVPGQVPQEA
mmetsp:Transcript_23970/g.57266  ORF Transcript_23970/g.57266 Transcript_23970/m.57266 type:complete len:295 (+) Transcript_23970:186-1070(+)